MNENRRLALGPRGSNGPELSAYQPSRGVTGQGLDPQNLTRRGLVERLSVIMRGLLYKATPGVSKARSSGKCCHEEVETDTECGMGTGMGVGRESRIVEQNPIRTMERETERKPKWEPKKPGNEEMRKPENQKTRKPGNQETRKPGNQEARKRGNEERPEAEGNTLREGDKAPNLMNERYSRI